MVSSCILAFALIVVAFVLVIAVCIGMMFLFGDFEDYLKD